MRMIMAATLLAASFVGSSAFAQDSSGTNRGFCLFTSSVQECDFDSMQQCLASKRGNADFCQPNNSAYGGGMTRE